MGECRGFGGEGTGDWGPGIGDRGLGPVEETEVKGNREPRRTGTGVGLELVEGRQIEKERSNEHSKTRTRKQESKEKGAKGRMETTSNIQTSFSRNLITGGSVQFFRLKETFMQVASE